VLAFLEMDIGKVREKRTASEVVGESEDSFSGSSFDSVEKKLIAAQAHRRREENETVAKLLSGREDLSGSESTINSYASEKREEKSCGSWGGDSGGDFANQSSRPHVEGNTSGDFPSELLEPVYAGARITVLRTVLELLHWKVLRVLPMS